MTFVRYVGALVLATSCAGCALTAKGDSNTFRYFTPEGAPVRAAPPVRSPVAPLELRLGKVDSASYIKDRIAFRTSEFEIGFYDELRWTEKPEAYVRRALVRSLFDENGVKQVVSGAGLVLEVDLDAFEEMRAPRHAAFVSIRFNLHGPQRVLLQRSITVERPLSSSNAESIAAGLAAALRDAIHAMVMEVVGELARDVAETPPKGGTDAAQ